MRDEKGDLIIDKGKIADLLNKHFHSIYTKEPDKELPEFNKRTNTNFCINDFLRTISLTEIREKIKRLNDSKSPGANGIHPLILKNCADSIVMPIKIIFEKSLMERRISELWRIANVIQIFKKGCRSDRRNYRPVSLTSIICKILEGFMRDGIMKYLIDNSLLYRDQHGFVPKKSCVTNLLETLDFLTEELSRGNNLDEILLDFSKAFDLVPHHRLVHKLRGYGFSEELVDWVKDYLSFRRQRVVMGEVNSDWVEVSSGVSQGSVLGPLLFVLYINDLPDRINNKIKLYADDSKILAVIKDWEDAIRLQDNLSSICQWMMKIG